MIVKWLLSKWIYGVAALAILALAGGIYQTGYNAAWRKAEVNTLMQRINTLERDKAIAQEAAARNANNAAELEALRRTDEEKIAQLQEIILDRNDRGLDQRELDGLLNIR